VYNQEASSDPTLINCSFSGNYAGAGGGGISNYNASATLSNCILWGNNTEIDNYQSAISYTNTLVKGLNTGGFNGTENPLFVSQPDFNSAPATAGNLRLTACSPAVNVGNNAAIAGFSSDLDGNTRIVTTLVDLGAYEYQFAPPTAIIPTISSTDLNTCGGTDGSISLGGFLINTTYTVSYKKNSDPVAANFISNGSGDIIIPNLGAGSYTDIVATYGACVSSAATATLVAPLPPALTLAAIPAVCAGTAMVGLPYTNATGSPNQYSLDFNSTANGVGFVDVTDVNLPASPIPVNIPIGAPAATYNATFTVRNSTTGCVSNPYSITVTINPVPTANLSASQMDVCPNTEVTLNPNCSIPAATVQWNPGAPTVTPDAPNTAYTYKVSCSFDGCTGSESSIEVRTHRVLIDLKNVGVGVQPKALMGAVRENLAPANVISTPTSPRLWTIVARGCSASESGVFKLSGPVNFNSIDNNPPYAIFANVGPDYFAIDHPNYGSGGSGFPNGTYTLTVDLRGGDGVGGPFPKNRVATGALLATRTLQFTLSSAIREGVKEPVAVQTPELSEEQWLSVGQNPVSSEVIVRLSGRVGQQVDLSLTNLQGQPIVQRKIVLNSVQQYEVLNVTQIPSGMYILKGHKDNLIKTIKVVKTL
jgi:hypothetical protein